MRSASGLLLLSIALIVPCAGWAQTNPTEEQLTRALSRPAAGKAVQSAGYSSQVTPGMLTGPNRGITLAPPVPAPVPASAVPGPVAALPTVPTTTDANPCAPDSGTCPLVVQFQTGSAVLSPAATATLDMLGRALDNPSNAGFKFRIVGHTDTVGSRELNRSLSLARAQAVAAYLEQHCAIPSARLDPVGVGKDELLVMTPDQTPEPRNRLVQVINEGT
jgi:outer membrane protein OmpA-like peptidoglycan-associated protein